MGKNAFSALRVVDGAAGQVSANGDANHHRRRKAIIGAPAHEGKLIAELHHGGPDVVEELNFDDRLGAANRSSDSGPHNGGFRQRRIENAVGTELQLQAGSQLENAPLAFDEFLLEILFPAAVGHVLAINNVARVVPHFVAQAGYDEVG